MKSDRNPASRRVRPAETLAAPSCPRGVISCDARISPTPLDLLLKPRVFGSSNRKIALRRDDFAVRSVSVVFRRALVERRFKRGLCRDLGGEDPKGGQNSPPPENEGAHGAGSSRAISDVSSTYEVAEKPISSPKSMR